MRPSKAMTVCATWALAMVFSVQQGEYGPLVVYKLQVPPSSGADTPAAPPAAQPETIIIEEPAGAPAPRGRRQSPLQPTILGTVVMPSDRAPLPLPPETFAPATFGGMPLQDPAPVKLAAPLSSQTSGQVPSAATVYRIVEDFEDDGALINQDTGGAVTLEQVNNALTWRRETAKKLRRVPIAPRF